jgi:AcrR family transcriptional regulator
MARTKGSSGVKTWDAIKAAGLSLIYRHGFAAMTLRQLAAAVGIREGSLYNYIDSKQALLFTIVDGHMDHLLASLEQAARSDLGADAKLRAFIEFHLRYHMERKAEVFVINSELRSLEADHLATILAKRDRYEAVLIAILAEFPCGDNRVAAKAVLAMLTGICTWFRPDGERSIDEIVGLYTKWVMSGVGR